MREFKDSDLAKLRWTQQNAFIWKWTLFSGTDIIGTIEIPRLFGKVIATSSEGALTFRRNQLFSPIIIIENGDGVHLADFKYDTFGGGGELSVVDGHKFFWHTFANYNSYDNWTFDNEQPFIQFCNPRFEIGTNANIVINQTTINTKELLILLTLGWYLYVRYHYQVEHL